MLREQKQLSIVLGSEPTDNRQHLPERYVHGFWKCFALLRLRTCGKVLILERTLREQEVKWRTKRGNENDKGGGQGRQKDQIVHVSRPDEGTGGIDKPLAKNVNGMACQDPVGILTGILEIFLDVQCVRGYP